MRECTFCDAIASTDVFDSFAAWLLHEHVLVFEALRQLVSLERVLETSGPTSRDGMGDWLYCSDSQKLGVKWCI